MKLNYPKDFLPGNFGAHQVIARIITEIVSRAVGWVMQKTRAFRKRGGNQ